MKAFLGKYRSCGLWRRGRLSKCENHAFGSAVQPVPVARKATVTIIGGWEKNLTLFLEYNKIMLMVKFSVKKYWFNKNWR